MNNISKRTWTKPNGETRNPAKQWRVKFMRDNQKHYKDFQDLDEAKQWRDEFLKENPFDARREGRGGRARKPSAEKRKNATERARGYNSQKVACPDCGKELRGNHLGRHRNNRCHPEKTENDES